MVRTHPSTPEQRAQWTAEMLAHPNEYGLITRLSREHNVSRPTLYAWRQRAQQCLLTAFTPPCPTDAAPVSLHRQVLTVLVDAHASERGIQSCLRTLTENGISLATISSILHQAQQRALDHLRSSLPASTRALALDEIYANDRRGAYLNVVDAQSGAVWASQGPLPVDCESWTLLLWELEQLGLRWDRVVLDGGAAMKAACRSVTPELPLQADQWHVLHSCSQLQARLQKHVRTLKAQTAVVERQAARIAGGKRPLGRHPKTDPLAHAQELAAAEQLTVALEYLMHELHRLLEVVVMDGRGLLSAQQRQEEMDSLLRLLNELASGAPSPQQALVQRLQTLVLERLPQLLTFVPQVAQLQHDLQAVLPPGHQAVLGWAWLHRRELGWSSEQIIAALPSDWRTAARMLWKSWEEAVRVSSAVERWHSILRPHLAVHRTLSTGMLALLAVWHNHRVFTRGVHKGKSPLHLSGMTDAPTDWLVALGYPPPEEVKPALAPAKALAA